jgi:cell division protein FtsI (penicillin-binding protein 3)
MGIKGGTGYRQRQRQHQQKHAGRRKAPGGPTAGGPRNTKPPGASRPAKYESYPHRFRIIYAVLVLLGVLILGKLLFIQLIDADNLKRRAQLSRNQALTLYSRGRILDRNGMILAQDTILYDLFVHPAYFFKASREDIARALAPAIKMDEKKLLAKLRQPYSTISIQKNLTKEQVELIAKARMQVIAVDPKTRKLILDDNGRPLVKNVPIPGLDFSRKTVRRYPQGNLAAHVLGYANDEANISSGVEAVAANVLKKKPTELSHTILDGRGNLVDLEKVDPRHIVTLPKAQDARLTIDARLQYVAERELANGLDRSHAARGAVIMMDPRTGELLAFAVQPTYQPQQFFKASFEELKNWAITDVYPPGSTFKILTVASGLETGVIHKNSIIQDSGKMKIGGWTIQNYDYGKHGAPGNIDLVYLLMHSSNIASAKISMMMPVQKHFDILRQLGIGSKTGIDLPGESAGIILPPNQWDESTHASIGYGYGTAATPMQIASAVASIANNGIWSTPHVIQGTPVVHKRIFSEKTCATMTELLTRSIKEAKTSTVRLEGIDVAGKTGTSRKPNPNGRGYSPNVFTSFVGYFPAQSPKVLIMVVVDSPQMAESWGSTVAGPIFKAIAEETVSHMGLRPVKITNNGVSGTAVPEATRPQSVDTEASRQATKQAAALQQHSAVTATR